ncbi:FAD-dependent monooxygenase [Elongatibacter sediminis]|uniref:FAD-dependent monooxygenase n=1 Tax=Elongatibacter sediminis TaxID=3119006 RepID=A0AAW9R8G5_9GAMM
MGASDQPDVLVIGAGMVGAAAACLFARAGLSVCVLQAKEPEPFDSSEPVGLRVSALSPGSVRILEAAGAWDAIAAERTGPYRRMRVEDRARDPAIEFTAAEFGLERLGTIVENDLVQWALWQNLKQLAAVERVCPADVESLDLFGPRPAVTLADGRSIRPDLLVGADGAGSMVRRTLGIGLRHTDYGQRALVSVVRTARPNPGLAWQRFLPGGPLAFLPLSDGASSIVWTRPSAEADRLLSLDDEAFGSELEGVAGENAEGPFGSIESTGPRAAFPLSLQLADRYTAGRCVLIGDAAHVVHPLAGQGVNLGFLDAAALVETAVAARRAGGDPGHEGRLTSFGRQRLSESEVMARGIHGLHTLFGPEAFGPVRRWGLWGVAGSWALRDGFIRRAAGIHAGAPALARGISLQDLVIG